MILLTGYISIKTVKLQVIMKKGIVGIIVLAFLVLIIGTMWMQRHSGNTSLGLLTKQDSIEIERLTGRKIIGEIDTTLFAPFERRYFAHDLKYEREFVIKILIRALDYHISDNFNVIHLFYDDKLSCPKDCPDMYVWLSDSEAIRLQKHISRISEGDSLITIKGDTILRRINVMDSSLSVTLGEDYHNVCEGSTTIFNLGWRSLTIHSHYHHFCQTHMTPGWYERMWISQNERKNNRK